MRLETAHPMVDRSDDGATGGWRWIRHQFGRTARALTSSDEVFVAAVNGAGAGVGLGPVLACDPVLVSERARFVTAFAQLGLANELVPHAELLPRASAWCARVSAVGPHAVAMAKPFLRHAADLPWEQAIEARSHHRRAPAPPPAGGTLRPP